MMKKLLLVSALVLASIDASLAAGIQESNLTAVSTMNPLDVLRIDLKSTSGNSRLITVSNFVNWLLTNNFNSAVTETNLAQGVTNSQPLHLYQFRIPNLRKQMATNGPIDIAGDGDSFSAGGMYEPLQQRLSDNWGGFGGAIGGQGSAYNNWIFGNGAYLTNSMTNSDFSWFGPYGVLPANSYCIMSNVAYGSFTGNLYSVAAIMEAGAGTVKIRTNVNLGAFADTTVASTNLAQASTVGKVVYKFTNTVSVGTQILVTNTGGGTAKIVSMGVLNRGTNGTVSFNDSAVPGSDISQRRAVGTNRWGPIWADYSPTMVVYCATDSTNIWWTNFFQYYQEFTNWCPHSDLVICDVHPKEDDNIAANNAASQDNILRSVCASNGIPYFSFWSLYRSFQQGTNDGLLRTGLDPHSTTAGYQFELDSFLSWLGIFDTGGSRPTPNIPYTGGDLLMNRNGSSGQRIAMTGPFSQFAGGSIQYLDGTGAITNAYYSFLPIAGGIEWLWRHHAGGADIMTLKSVSGTTTLEGGTAGVPFNIGEATSGVWSLMTTNFYKRPLAGAATTIGNVLKATDTAGQGDWASLSNTYTLTLMSSAANTPADSTTYYVGGDFGGNDITSYNQARVIIPKAGTIKRIWVKINMTVASSAGESCTISLRLNNSTDTTVINQNWSANPSEFDNNALSIAVASGDFIALKFAHPAWTTNPTGVRIYAIVYIE